MPPGTMEEQNRTRVHVRLAPASRSLLRQLSYRQSMAVTQMLVLRTPEGPSCYALCPRCGISLEREYMSFCDRCGQKLDWDSYDEASPVFPGHPSLP